MEVITITFAKKNASDRRDEIKAAIQPYLPFEIISAKLFKSGYPYIDYGHGDEDLVFADGLKVIIESV